MRENATPNPSIPVELFNLRALMEVRNAWHPALFKRYNVVATAIGFYRFRQEDAPELTVRNAAAKPRTLRNSCVNNESWPCVLVFVKNWVPLDTFHSRQTLARSVSPMTNPLQLVPALLEYGTMAVPTCVISVNLDDDGLASIREPDYLGADNLFGGGSAVCTRVQQIDHYGTVACLATDRARLYALTAGHVCGHTKTPVYPLSRSAEEPIGTTGKCVGHVPFSRLFPAYPFDENQSTLDVGLIDVDDASAWTSTLYEVGDIGDVYDSDVDLGLLGQPVKGYGARSHAVRGEVTGLFPVYKSMAGQCYSAHLLVGPREGDPTGFRNAKGDSGALYVLDEPGVGTYRPLAINWGLLDFEDDEKDTHFSLATMCNVVCRELEVDLVPTHNTGFGPVWGASNHRLIGDFLLKALAATDGPLHGLLTGNHTTEVDIHKLVVFPDCWSNAYTASRILSGMTGVFRKGEGPNHYCDIEKKGSVYTPTGDGRIHQRVGEVFGEMKRYAADKKFERFYCAAWVLAHYCADMCNPAHVSIYPKGHESWLAEKDDKGKPKNTGFHGIWDNAVLSMQLDQELAFNALTGDILDEKSAQDGAYELLKHTLDTIDVIDYVLDASGQPKQYQDACAEAKQFIRSAIGQRRLADCMKPACEFWYRLVLSAWAACNEEGLSDEKMSKKQFQDVMNSILLDKKTFMPVEVAVPAGG